MKSKTTVLILIAALVVGGVAFIVYKMSSHMLSPVPDENAVKVIIVSPTTAP